MLTFILLEAVGWALVLVYAWLIGVFDCFGDGAES